MQYRFHFAAVSALILVGAMAVANAGERKVAPVTISEYYAQGALADARASNDKKQVIGCYSAENMGLCYAVDESGTSRVCMAYDAEQLAVIRSLTTEAKVVFGWNQDGTCRNISIGTYSLYKPGNLTGY